MAPPPPTSPVQVVTVTVVSSASSATSGAQVSSGSSSSSVPIAAIAGGTAGGVALALILVLIWKYWGRMIKRTERQRRKEAQDTLTVRENTRRNAASGFRPQSQYRPMFTLNPENRRVTFIARPPTASRAQQNDTSSDMASPADEANRETQNSPAAPPGLDEIQQPSTSSSAAAPLLVAHEPEQSDSWQSPEQHKTKPVAPRRPPSPTPTPTRTRAHMQARDLAPTTPAPPTPPRSPQRAVFGSSIHTPSSPTPTPSSRTLTPTSTPSPPSSSAGLRMSSVTTAQGRSATPVPPAPPISTVASSSSLPPPPSLPQPYALSGTRSSPLRNSVLPSSDDRPVIMPRAKNVPAPPTPTELLTSTSPVSLRPSVPSLASSVSQYSAASGEPPVRRGVLDSLGRRHKSVVGTIASSTRRTSTLSSASVYSNND